MRDKFALHSITRQVALLLNPAYIVARLDPLPRTDQFSGKRFVIKINASAQLDFVHIVIKIIAVNKNNGILVLGVHSPALLVKKNPGVYPIDTR
ncbi:hypothetical protein [Candidatus Spongiihabitans sp.]|uniref:hypothetical protein n=1 Tax=Candidatus Spongiihabitans sp. TaxID=3101308 RepID=UPI003C7B1E4F